jgi:hypothetical protein
MFVKTPTFDGSLLWASDYDKEAVRHLKAKQKDLQSSDRTMRQRVTYVGIRNGALFLLAMAGLGVVTNLDIYTPKLFMITMLTVVALGVVIDGLPVIVRQNKYRKMIKDSRILKLPSDFVASCQNLMGSRLLDERRVDFLLTHFPEKMQWFREALTALADPHTGGVSRDKLIRGIRRTFEPFVRQAIAGRTDEEVAIQADANDRLLGEVGYYDELEGPNPDSWDK